MPVTIGLDCETRPHPSDVGENESSPSPELEFPIFEMRPEGAEHGWTALNPALATVAMVGLIHVESGKEVVFGIPADERHALLMVANALEKATRIVGFNSRAFDLPLLIHRMVIHGVRVPLALRRAMAEKPWESERHVDVREAMTFNGKVRGPGTSLRAFALAYGLHDPKAHGDGRASWELEPKELGEYCLGDVRTTLALYEKWRAAMEG